MEDPINKDEAIYQSKARFMKEKANSIYNWAKNMSSLWF